jgi:hypothetical protein
LTSEKFTSGDLEEDKLYGKCPEENTVYIKFGLVFLFLLI